MQGRFEEADSDYRRALAIQEKALGPDHPEVADTLGRIAPVAGYLGRPDAESMFRRALAILDTDAFADSPELATTLAALANHLDDVGEYPEARDLVRRALGIQERLLPANDPAIAGSCLGLGHMYFRHFDRLDEAEPLYARALAIWGETLRVDDPTLLMAQTDYVELLRRLGREDEARAFEAKIPPELRGSIPSSAH